LLNLLKVSGFALIDELELPLGPGLTVISGETGAGKSILVDALGLLRGVRSSADVIRTGRDEARVEAVLEVPPANPVRAGLLGDGREIGDDGLLVRRTITRQGRGRISLGGSLATAGDLVVSLGRLIDIASQHDQQSLTDPESQLAILDAFGEHDALLASMRDAHRAWQEAVTALAAFDGDVRTRIEREDLIRFQLAELETAALEGPDEDSVLRVERERLRHAEKLHAAASRSVQGLYEGDEAVVDRMGVLARELASLSALDPALGGWAERLEAARASIEEVARELGRYADGAKADPARLSDVEERLYLLQRLARKYGGTLADALARRATLSEELAGLASFEQGLAERQARVATTEKDAQSVAARLSSARKTAAGALSRKVNQTLGELGLGLAKLPIDLEVRGELGPTGQDRVRFLFNPNPGEDPKPLAKIASGGELSRVMLALKQALARTDQVQTYVFDEIDAGVGGATGETIGRKLKAIASAKQVIVVTHLAQIAAFADTHLQVCKDVVEGRTLVRIRRLDEKARKAEIARMLSGHTTKQATAHADEMLKRARRAPEIEARA